MTDGNAARTDSLRAPGRIPIVAGPLLGAATGAATVALAVVLGGNPLQMAALPAALALLAFLILDRTKLLIAILALRSAGDLLFESTRVSLGGYQIGVGGLINAFVILIVALLVLERPQRLPRGVAAMWIGFLLAAIAGVALTPVQGDAIRTCLSLLSYLAIFAGAFYVTRSAEDFRFCVKVILWSSAIPAAYALVELATGGAHRASGFRLQSTFAHPNIFAFYLTLVISLALYLLKSGAAASAPVTRAALGAYMLYLLALLLFTQTRSAWIACFAMFVLYAVLYERRYIAYLTLAPVLALLVPGVHDRLLDLGAGNEYVQYARLNSFAWRRLLWETGLQWMRPDHYLFGYGLESFRHYSLTFFPLANQAGVGHGAHNIYVQIFFELGAIGLAAYLWLFGRLLWWLKGLIPADRLAAVTVIGATVVYLITSVSDNMFAYLSFNWYFWFLMGAACAWSEARRPPEGPAVNPAHAAGNSIRSAGMRTA